MPDRYEAILFDFDGVLADSEPVHFECWREILRPWGIHLDWDMYLRECAGIADSLMLRRFCNAATPPLDFDAIWAEYPRKREMFRARMEETDVVPRETVDLIRHIGPYKLAVVTSSGRAEVEPPLVRAGIRDHFGALVCGLESPKLKPAPDPYLKAAELLEVRRALVVEDSDAGEQSGRTAGFDVLRVAHPSEVAQKVRGLLGGG
jgi:HAD superfamily hydrolase (TIGR01509 family)